MKTILWDNMAKRYDRRFGKWYEQIFTEVLPHMSENNEILEIGCGSGLLSFKIIPHVKRFVGYDLSKDMIDQCKIKLIKNDYGNAHFVKGDIMNPPYLGVFDKVLLVNLLHVVDNPKEVLSQVRRYLTPKSTLLILSYCHGEKMAVKYTTLSFFMNIGSKLGLMSKLHRFTFDELRDMVINSGFNVKEERRNSEGFPFLFLQVKLEF